MKNLTRPLGCFRRLGNNLQVLNQAADVRASLTSENQPSKPTSLPLSILRHRTESNVLRHRHPPLPAGEIEKLVILQTVRPFLNRVNYVHPAPPQLASHCQRHMNVKIERCWRGGVSTL